MTSARLYKGLIAGFAAAMLAVVPISEAQADHKKKTDDAIKGALIGAGVGALIGKGRGAAAGAILGAVIGANAK
ncbi:hypothetical protein M3P21_02020 [Ruegeria sp. 2012CJ41-6]|uniref:YMGG-like Gly-zipper domain-containing protein n=1 Tax=Ruegeria spongiae TaxID=2942209 RepID=A0ABT0PXP6_9RHOB|nr:hypothetical protein [Ruegeria spongiae]MCL6282292.1 hypothetical protein [Ruegeria spongiae]